MSSAGPVVVLAGGTGGARLARGVLEAGVPPEELVVVVNTADDVEIHGAHVSPDPDLVTFWLADLIDARGWGLRGDTFAAMDMLRALGDEVWFQLGDRDLALCLRRARRLAEGATPSVVLAEHARALGVRARVVPMCDAPVRTRVRAEDRWWPLQELLIRRTATGPIQDVAFDGAQDARAATGVREAVVAARAVLIGPSNPVISIGPILAVPGVADALRRTPAPVVAVAPFVGGRVLKGPTAAFMAWAGRSADADGVLATYAGLVDGVLTDEADPDDPADPADPGSSLPAAGARRRRAAVLLDTQQRRAEVVREALAFAEALHAEPGPPRRAATTTGADGP